MSLLFLLSLLIFCHFLADFCFTTSAMLQAKASGKKWWHIILHAAVHATLMGAVMMGVAMPFYGVTIEVCLALMILELVTHFVIDYAKGWVGRKIPHCAETAYKAYWVLYGFDQMLHLLVIVVIVALLALFSNYPIL